MQALLSAVSQPPNFFKTSELFSGTFYRFETSFSPLEASSTNATWSTQDSATILILGWGPSDHALYWAKKNLAYHIFLQVTYKRAKSHKASAVDPPKSEYSFISPLLMAFTLLSGASVCSSGGSLRLELFVGSSVDVIFVTNESNLTQWRMTIFENKVSLLRGRFAFWHKWCTCK